MRSFIDDLPAHDLDAEERVLGAIMIGPSGVVDELIELGMSVASFYSLNHRLIWASAIEVTLRDEKPDEILIIDQLRRNGLLEKVGGPSSVLSLAHTATTVTGVAAHARVLRDQEQRREARAIAIELGDVSGNGFKPERVGQLRERLDALAANPAGSNKLRLTPQSAAALMTLPEPPESDEILGRLVIRRQRLVIGAATGDGKTTMTLQIIRAIALGQTFLDWQGREGRCLVIDLEQGVRTIKRRLREAGLDESRNVDILHCPDGLALDTDATHVAEVKRVLTQGKYDVVLVDPLYKAHTGDSNDERSAVDLMRRFDKWRDDLGFALIIPVHTRKPPPATKFTVNELFGSSAYQRGAEIVLGLQRVRPGYSRLHFFKDRDGDLPVGTAWGLLFDRETGYRRDPDDQAERKPATEHIRDLLASDPGITTKAIHDVTGYADRTIRKALREIGATTPTRAGKHGEKAWQLPLETPTQ